MTADEPLEGLDDLLEVLDQVVLQGQRPLGDLHVAELDVAGEDEEPLGGLWQEDGVVLVRVRDL